MKTQTIRLADVFFVGPVMLLGGFKLADRGDKMLGSALGALGILTILYNGNNYLKVEAEKKKQSLSA